MKNKILFAFTLCLMIIVSSCRKDTLHVEKDIELPLPKITVETTLIGLVTDLDGNSIEGAMITLGGNQTTTDENGYFKLTGLVNAANEIVKVEMAGYFDSWHSFQHFDEDNAKTRIMLIPRQNPTIISGNEGGGVTFDNTRITFQPNSFVDAEGFKYTGDVNIYSAYLDPSHINLNSFMPGNLMGIDVNNSLKLLESYGMINIELEGVNGQKLQIDKAADLELTVPSSFLNRAPSTIPLWYFDTEIEQWVEDGMASLQDDKYVGKINHFTFWNCDEPLDFVDISGQILHLDAGLSLTVCVTNISNGDKRCMLTSANDGYFAGPVPIGEELLLEFYSICDELVYTDMIGPFFDDPAPEVYQLDINETFALIQGEVVNCDDQAVTNGYVVGSWGNTQTDVFSLNESGQFSNYINTCGGTEITLYAIDIDNLKSSNPSNYAISPNAVINANTLKACDNNVVDGIYLEYGSDTHFIQGATVTSGSVIKHDGTPGIEYIFIVNDDQGNGQTVNYDIRIVDYETGEDTYAIAPLSWQGSMPYYFVCDEGEVVMNKIGTIPGETVEIELTNAALVISDGGVETMYTGGNFKIIGIIQ